MGTADRLTRLVIAAVLAYLYSNGILEGTLGLIALVISGIFLLTSLISFCPLYPMLGINTCSKKD